MGIQDVRGGLETVLRGVDGVRSFSGWPKENVGAPVSGYVGFADTPIVPGATELQLHQLPIYVFVSLSGGNLTNELKATEGVVTAILNALRLNQKLGLGANGPDHVRLLRIREGVYGHGGTDYVGFILDVEVKERRGAQYGQD